MACHLKENLQQVGLHLEYVSLKQRGSREHHILEQVSQYTQNTNGTANCQLHSIDIFDYGLMFTVYCLMSLYTLFRRIVARQ